MLDPAINSVERITRSFNIRLGEIGRIQHFVELSQGIDPTISKDLESQVDILRNKAGALGIAVNTSRKGQVLGFGRGVQRERTTDRIKAFGASWDDSLLSTVAHAETLGILSQGAHVEATNPLRVAPGLSPEREMHLIAKPTEWVARALWAYYQLFGWDPNEGKAMLEATYDQVGLRDEFRFWR